jgi:fibrillarin-like rRNA methylase
MLEKDWFPQRRKGAKKIRKVLESYFLFASLSLRLCAFAGTLPSFLSDISNSNYYSRRGLSCCFL